jgi:type IV pilus assembly protein PilW
MKKINTHCMRIHSTGLSSGFGLIELMIAMTIGLILLGGIGYVFLGSKQTFRTQDDFSRMQESVRYALETVGVDVRMAGYAGCVNLAAINPNNPGGGVPLFVKANQPPALLLGEALRGYVGATWPVALNPPPAGWVAGTGVLHIISASSAGVRVEEGDQANANIKFDTAHGFVVGQLLLVTDCESADLFRASNVAGNGTITHTGANCANIGMPCNVATAYQPNPQALSKSYPDTAEVFSVVSTIYFIAINPAGNPALYRRPEGGAAEELVENVEDLVMRFGMDDGNGGTANDFIVDRYVAAGGVTNWRQVMTARVSMIFRSNSNNVATQLQPCVVEYTSCTPADLTDRRLRQVATATFGLRNRLP